MNQLKKKLIKMTNVIENANSLNFVKHFLLKIVYNNNY